jgi:hypothetical protein
LFSQSFERQLQQEDRDDSKNKSRLQSAFREGEEPGRSVQIEISGGKAAAASGIFQAQQGIGRSFPEATEPSGRKKTDAGAKPNSLIMLSTGAREFHKKRL